MKKTIKISLILGLALCLIMSMALLVACDPKNNNNNNNGNDQTDTALYTVSVSCEQDEALTGVTVKLNNADGTLAGEKPLRGGKATFEFEDGEYFVELAGLPEEYGYDDPAALTKDASSCTVTVAKANEYSVSVSYPDVKDIYGNTVIKKGPVSGMQVLLYTGKLEDDRGSAIEGLHPAKSAVTDANGMANFKLPNNTYTIVIPEYARGLEIFYPLIAEKVYVNTVTKANPFFGVTFTQRYLYGESDTVPIAFEIGDNNVPLSLDLLTNVLTEAPCAFYSFTPEKTGNYTFSAKGNAKVGSEVFGNANLFAGKPIVVHLEAGTEYLFSCGISTTSGNLAYTITIEEGGEIDDGGVEAGHTYPWAQGKGTLKAPFTTTTLSGEYTNLYVAAESHFYLAYTPSTNETYTFSAVGDNLWLQVYDDVENIPTLSNYLIEIGDDTPSAECELTAGTTYYILIGTMNDEADSVGFKAEKKNVDDTPTDKATYTVTVVGKDSSGNIEPLAGVSVTIRDADQTTKTTDANGKVSFEVAPGPYGILLSNIPSNYRDDNTDTAFAVSKSEPNITITLTKIENTHKVSITVKYADGKLAEQGLTVRLVASNNSAFDEKTNANGVATFDVADGEYTVQVPQTLLVDGAPQENGPKLDSGQQFHKSRYSVKVNGSDTSIEAAYNYTRSVDITVKNADGTPAANRTVDIIDKYDNEYEAETDANGVAHFDNVIEGEYDIFVTDKTGGDGKLTVEGGNAQKTLTI